MIVLIIIAAIALVVAGGAVWRFALHSPAQPQSNGAAQQGVPVTAGVAVARDVPSKLRRPPICVGLGDKATLRARVPEAPVDEYDDPRPGE